MKQIVKKIMTIMTKEREMKKTMIATTMKKRKKNMKRKRNKMHRMTSAGGALMIQTLISASHRLRSRLMSQVSKYILRMVDDLTSFF